MKLKQSAFRLPLVVVAVFFAVAGCSSSGTYAPVVEKQVEREIESGVRLKKPVATVDGLAMKTVPRLRDGRSQAHVVQKGDTLYSIAFSYGLDYREIAGLNNIQNYDLIQLGRELRLPLPSSSPLAAAGTVAVVTNAVESRPLEAPVSSQPKVTKVSYGEQAVVQVEKMQEVQKPEPVTVARVQVRPETRPEPRINGVADDDDAALEWGMPTSGRIIGEFSETTGRKGIDIAGKLGQPIVASSAGKVVYCGTGLRGYGKLIIIKHNKTYLSAYAHNDQLLVKEGQNVSKGQKIAEMGNTDTDQVRLHFEIRRFGKPVDPARYLPVIKS